MNASRRVVHVPRIAPGRSRAAAGLAAAGLALVLAGCSASNPATIATPFDPADGRSAQIGGEKGSDGNYNGNGGIKLRGFLVVSKGSQQPGVLVGAISNDTDQAAQLRLAIVTTDSSGQQQPLGTTQVSLQPGQFVQFGNPVGASGTAAASASSSAPTGSPTGSASATPSPANSVGSSVTTTPTPSASTTPTEGVTIEPAAGQTQWLQVPSVPVPAGGVLELVAQSTTGGGASLVLPILPPVEEYAAITPTTAAAASPTASGTPPAPAGSAGPSANPSDAAKQPTPSTSG